MPFNESVDADDYGNGCETVKQDGHHQPPKFGASIISATPNNPSKNGETEAAEYPPPPRQEGRIETKHVGNDTTKAPARLISSNRGRAKRKPRWR